jgi:NAD(P)-dependent dehydrogenase (short-subunit alcohol dehydrogenase family)
MKRPDPSRFDGKVALITGSTQGLGEAVARTMVRRGLAGVLVTGRNEERGATVAAELDAVGCRAVFVAADLSEPSSPARLADAVDDAFGRVDVLVNSAAITDRDSIWDATPEFFDRMLAVNVRAPFLLMQGAARLMQREGIAGTIVNVSSTSAYGGQPFLTTYCTSKGALVVLTRNVANALLPHRIRVNAVAPGWMATPGEDRIQREYHGAGDDWLERAAEGKPFGRILDPDEVARVIAFLASDESGMTTGAVLDVDQRVIGAWD